MSIARTIMLHAAIHWPETADATLWPMTVQYAVYIVNRVPDPTTGLSPFDIFTRTTFELSTLRNLHVFGCPVYALNPTISNGKKLPRWQPRSKRKVNMRLPSKHTSTVPLVLDLDTGYITTNFHVVLDDWFTTVASEVDELPDFESDEWYKLFGESTYQYMLEEDDMSQQIDLSHAPTLQILQQRESVARAYEDTLPSVPLNVAPLPSVPIMTQHTGVFSSNPDQRKPSPREPTRGTSSSPREPLPEAVAEPFARRPVPEQTTTPSNLKPAPNPTQAMTPEPRTPSPSQAKIPALSPSLQQQSRRPARTRQPPKRYGYDGNQGHGYTAVTNFDATTISFVPTAFAASSSDPDTLTNDGAMTDIAHQVDWQKSAVQEVIALVEKGTWDEVDHIATAKSRILPGT